MLYDSLFEHEELERYRAKIEDLLSSLSNSSKKTSGVGVNLLLNILEKSRYFITIMRSLLGSPNDLSCTCLCASRGCEEYWLALSNLRISIEYLLDYQVDKEQRYIGAFDVTIDLEKECFGGAAKKTLLFASWPRDFDAKYKIIKAYKVENDPLFIVFPYEVCDTENCSQAFQRVLEKLELGSSYDRERFSNTTTELLRRCCDLWGAVAPVLEGTDLGDPFLGKGFDAELVIEERVARVILCLRAVLTTGLDIEYNESLNTVLGE